MKHGLHPLLNLRPRLFARHSNVHKALGADLNSYPAYVAAGFYRDVADGLSLVVVDRTANTVMGVLIVRAFITPAPSQLDDTRCTPFRRSPIIWN